MKLVSGMSVSGACVASRDVVESLLRYGSGGCRNPVREDLDKSTSLRWLVAGISAAALVLTFLILAAVSPRFEVTRSDQSRGALGASVPEATTQVFLAMTSAEACADANGIGRPGGIRPEVRVFEGASYATMSAWREGCGGMTLSIPLRDGLAQDAVRRTLSAFQTGIAAIERGRTGAAGDAAAAFHEAARRNGVGYRLVGYSLR